MTSFRRTGVRSVPAGTDGATARAAGRRRAAPAALALALAAAAAGTAAAHSEPSGTSPAAGATLTRAPAQVVVTYSDPLLEVVSGEATVDGRRVSGAARIDAGDRRRVVIPLTARPPGRYRVAWTVVGPDTHPVSGESAFTVRATPVPASLRTVQVRVRTTGPPSSARPRGGRSPGEAPPGAARSGPPRAPSGMMAP